MSDFMDELMDDMGLKDPEPATPEEGLYNYWVNTKPHPKIYNCQYWLKHELYVYKTFLDRGCFMSKPGKAGQPRQQMSIQEYTEECLKYYFRMVTLSSFEGERHAERGKLVDLDKFVALVLEHPVIKKLMDNPNTLL